MSRRKTMPADRHREVAIKINMAGRRWQELRREIERVVRDEGGKLPERRETYCTPGIDRCMREAEAALPDLDEAKPEHYVRAAHLAAVTERMIEMETHRLRSNSRAWIDRRFDPDEVAAWRRSQKRRQVKEAVVS